MTRALVIRSGDDGRERVVEDSSVPTEAALHEVLMRHPSLVSATDLGFGRMVTIGFEASLASGSACSTKTAAYAWSRSRRRGILTHDASSLSSLITPPLSGASVSTSSSSVFCVGDPVTRTSDRWRSSLRTNWCARRQR